MLSGGHLTVKMTPQKPFISWLFWSACVTSIILPSACTSPERNITLQTHYSTTSLSFGFWGNWLFFIHTRYSSSYTCVLTGKSPGPLWIVQQTNSNCFRTLILSEPRRNVQAVHGHWRTNQGPIQRPIQGSFLGCRLNQWPGTKYRDSVTLG